MAMDFIKLQHVVSVDDQSSKSVTYVIINNS